MEMPVAGLMMGMALRPRVAEGWCNFRLDCCPWKLGGTKAGEELREKLGATVWGCWVGEDSGELLASDERSDALEMDTSCGDVSDGEELLQLMVNTHVGLRQQVGTELEIVLELKGTASLELDTEGGESS